MNSSSSQESEPGSAVSVFLGAVPPSDGVSDTSALDALQDRLEHAGMQVTARERLPGDTEALAARIEQLLEERAHHAILLVGGAPLPHPDPLPQVVESFLDPALPGYGELFRMLYFQQVGAQAMRERVTGGLARGIPIFVLPASPQARQLVLDELLLSQLDALRRPLPRSSGEPGPAAGADPSGGGLQVEARPSGPGAAPDAPADASPAPPGWKGAVQALGGEVETGHWLEIPEVLAAIDPLRNVLEGAGQRGALVLPEGEPLALFGFPDLLRPSSKVLAVGDAAPHGLLVALHRYPRWVGLAVADSRLPLPHPHDGVGAICEQRTGRPCPRAGAVLAVEGSSVYLLDDRRVWSWDGRDIREEGTLRATLVSLTLRWSRR